MARGEISLSFTKSEWLINTYGQYPSIEEIVQSKRVKAKVHGGIANLMTDEQLTQSAKYILAEYRQEFGDSWVAEYQLRHPGVTVPRLVKSKYQSVGRG